MERGRIELMGGNKDEGTRADQEKWRTYVESNK